MAWFQKPVRILVTMPFLSRITVTAIYGLYFYQRLGWNHQIAACIAKPVSYYISRLIRSMGAIPVYRGTRQVLDTIEASEAALLRGESLLLFPDVDYTNSSGEMGKMYQGFLHLEKYYYKSTGKHIPFVPLYVSKKTRRIVTGNAIRFGRQEDFKQEKEGSTTRSMLRSTIWLKHAAISPSQLSCRLPVFATSRSESKLHRRYRQKKFPALRRPDDRIASPIAAFGSTQSNKRLLSVLWYLKTERSLCFCEPFITAGSLYSTTASQGGHNLCPQAKLLHRLTLAHGQDGAADQIIQLPTQHFSTPLDHFPGAAGGKIGCFIFFLD